MFRSLSLCILLLVPGLASAASKEVQLLQELQRDVATLQDLVKSMQRSQDEKIGEVRALVDQSMKASSDAAKSVSAIQTSLQQSVRDQEGKVVAPVVNLSRQMDSMSKEFETLSSYVTELQRSLNKMQSQLNDIDERTKLMQTPAAAPPPPAGGGETAAAPQACNTELVTSADRDRQGGMDDLALRGYTEYVKVCGDRPDAARAQYYIGALHFKKEQFAAAAADFDALLEKYPADNPLRPQAFFYKGVSLTRLDRRTEAAAEFQALIKEYPKDPLAAKARDELKNLGYNPPRTAPATKSGKKK